MISSVFSVLLIMYVFEILVRCMAMGICRLSSHEGIEVRELGRDFQYWVVVMRHFMLSMMPGTYTPDYPSMFLSLVLGLQVLSLHGIPGEEFPG